MPTPEELETEAVRQEFKAILENFYEGLPETRKKFQTDKRLQEYDLTVTKKNEAIKTRGNAG